MPDLSTITLRLTDQKEPVVLTFHRKMGSPLLGQTREDLARAENVQSAVLVHHMEGRPDVRPDERSA